MSTSRSVVLCFVKGRCLFEAVLVHIGKLFGHFISGRLPEMIGGILGSLQETRFQQSWDPSSQRVQVACVVLQRFAQHQGGGEQQGGRP